MIRRVTEAEVVESANAVIEQHQPRCVDQRCITIAKAMAHEIAILQIRLEAKENDSEIAFVED